MLTIKNGYWIAKGKGKEKGKDKRAAGLTAFLVKRLTELTA
ncbi:hypothetical protein [Erwinia endophytica]|nr:hypothetical protein [Erwinia endophytica]